MTNSNSGVDALARDLAALIQGRIDAALAAATVPPSSVPAAPVCGDPWPGERDVLAPRDVARILGLSEQTVTAALRRGELPGVQVGRRWLVDKYALAAAIGRSRV